MYTASILLQYFGKNIVHLIELSYNASLIFDNGVSGELYTKKL